MAEDNKAEQLRAGLQGQAGKSASMLHHEGIRALATDDSPALADLTEDEIEVYSVLRALNEFVPMPHTMKFIKEQISLSRAKDRKGRLEYAGCFKSYPNYWIAPGQQAPGMADTAKRGIFDRIRGRGASNEEQQ